TLRRARPLLIENGPLTNGNAFLAGLTGSHSLRHLFFRSRRGLIRRCGRRGRGDGATFAEAGCSASRPFVDLLAVCRQPLSEFRGLGLFGRRFLFAFGCSGLLLFFGRRIPGIGGSSVDDDIGGRRLVKAEQSDKLTAVQPYAICGTAKDRQHDESRHQTSDALAPPWPCR